MGTKLECALNLLAAASSREISIVDETQPANKVSGSETRADCQKLQSSMERMIEDLHSFESIRKAMLEHDRLFRQQVKELHRVYGVQKMLMNEVKHKLRFSAQSRGCRVDSTRLADGHGPPPEVASGCSLSAPVLKSYPCFNETSGSCSGENQIKPGCSYLERPAHKLHTAALESGQRRHKETESSFNRNRHDEEEEEEGADVELTLSIGIAKNCNQRMKKTQQPHCSDTDLLYSKSNGDRFEVKVKNGSSPAVEEPEPGRGEEHSNLETKALLLHSSFYSYPETSNFTDGDWSTDVSQTRCLKQRV